MSRLSIMQQMRGGAALVNASPDVFLVNLFILIDVELNLINMFR